MSLPGNTLERIGVVLLGMRVIGNGLIEEMARDGADDDYEPVGAITGMLIRVQNDTTVYPVLTFENGEYEDMDFYFVKGDDPDVIAMHEEGTLNDEAWENFYGEEGVLYSSQILASMRYGTTPFVKGDYDFLSLLKEFGIDEVNLVEDETGENSISNADIDKQLVSLFLEEAKSRGIDPFKYVGCSYSID